MTPADPLVMAGVVVMLAATSAVTLVLLVRRATRVDPIVTLRDE